MAEQHKWRNLAILPTVAIVLALLDQLTKWLVRSTISGTEALFIIPGILHITPTENTGSVFGLFKGQQIPLILLTIVVIAVLLYLIFSRKLPQDKLAKICAVLLLAGALGNLVDRVMRGAVFDFVDLQIWPIFNLADAMITGGVLGLLYRELFKPGSGKSP